MFFVKDCSVKTRNLTSIRNKRNYFFPRTGKFKFSHVQQSANVGPFIGQITGT